MIFVILKLVRLLPSNLKWEELLEIEAEQRPVEPIYTMRH
jgi:hypothetical protein